MVVWEIEARRGPASQVPVNVGIVPFPEKHDNVGTAYTPESRISTGAVHVCTDMMTVVQIPRRNGSPTMLPWTQ